MQARDEATQQDLRSEARGSAHPTTGPELESKLEKNPLEKNAREKDAPRTQSRTRPYAILAGVGFLVLGAIGVHAFLTANTETTDDAQITSDLVPISARVSGMCAEILIKENQHVKVGDLLVRLDPADYQIKVEQAEAELATAVAQAAASDAQVESVETTSSGGLTSAKAMLTGSSAALLNADAEIAVAKASVLRARAEVQRTKTEADRAATLRKENAISQERFDAATSAFSIAEASLLQADAQLRATEGAKRSAEAHVGEMRGRVTQSTAGEAQVTTAKAQAQIAHARVKAAEAQLAFAKLQLSYTSITAPTNGIASRLSAHAGQLLSTGQPILSLVPEETYVVANFKETQIDEMRVGQRAEISIDAYPRRSFTGKVESLSGGTGSVFALLPADNATGNFVKVVQRVPVRIAWTSPPDVPLYAGLSAEVHVRTEESKAE